MVAGGPTIISTRGWRRMISSPLLARHPATATFRSGFSCLSVLNGQAPSTLFCCLFTGMAGVEQDHIGIIHIFCLRVACGLHGFNHPLTVMNISDSHKFLQIVFLKMRSFPPNKCRTVWSNTHFNNTSPTDNVVYLNCGV